MQNSPNIALLQGLEDPLQSCETFSVLNMSRLVVMADIVFEMSAYKGMIITFPWLLCLLCIAPDPIQSCIAVAVAVAIAMASICNGVIIQQFPSF